MTRFLYIADTHLGANPMGYQQQKGYPEKLEEIVRALRDYISAAGGVDFVLHGGDMIDSTTDDNILAAVDAFDLSVPVYLCLGNHDLTATDAAERWLKLAPRFFADATPVYTVTAEHCVVHVVPNHWCDIPFYWHEGQGPHFSAAQVERLSQDLRASPHLPHLIVTHTPVHGLPVEQTGLREPLHCPDPSFTAQMSAILADHENVKCVLGGHNHMNMRVDQNGVEFVTVSALVETPFEFKLFEVTPDSMTMSTVSLGRSLAIDGEYDAARTFVQGRAVDRQFTRKLGQERTTT